MIKRVCIGLLFSLLFLFYTSGYSQETITLTTYYPSPFGIYSQLVTNTIGVGDQTGNGIDANDAPDPLNTPGNAWIAGDMRISGNGVRGASDSLSAALEVDDSIIYNPRSGNPDVWPNGTIGEVAYSSSNDDFYYFNGSNNWVRQGGGGSYCFIRYNNNPNQSPGCPSRFTKEASLGVYGYDGWYTANLGLVPYPPGGGRPKRCSGGFSCSLFMNTYMSRFDVGQASLCCK